MNKYLAAAQTILSIEPAGLHYEYYLNNWSVLQ
jgi:hypothetical protein